LKLGLWFLLFLLISWLLSYSICQDKYILNPP